MAKEMNWTEVESDVTYNSSYWKPIQNNFDDLHSTGQITFCGWKSRTARNNNKRPIGTHTYQITPEILSEFFAESVLKDAGKSFRTQAYALAMETLDVLVTPAVGETPAVYKSFFDGALDV